MCRFASHRRPFYVDEPVSVTGGETYAKGTHTAKAGMLASWSPAKRLDRSLGAAPGVRLAGRAHSHVGILAWVLTGARLESNVVG